MHGLCSIRSLTSLSLQSCVRLTSACLGELAGRLPGLRQLNLRGCLQLTDAGLGCLGSLSALEDLNLHGCTGITGGYMHG